MVDPHLQERFTRGCTDAAFGYTSAATAAYASFAEQVFDYWIDLFGAAVEASKPKTATSAFGYPVPVPARREQREPPANPFAAFLWPLAREPERPQASFPLAGFPMPGFPMPGFPMAGLPMPAFPMPAFPMFPFPMPAFAAPATTGYAPAASRANPWERAPTPWERTMSMFPMAAFAVPGFPFAAAAPAPAAPRPTYWNPFEAWLALFPMPATFSTPAAAPMVWPMAFMLIASGVPRQVAWPTAEANAAAMEAADAAAVSVRQAFSSYHTEGGHAAMHQKNWAGNHLLMLATALPLGMSALLAGLRGVA